MGTATVEDFLIILVAAIVAGIAYALIEPSIT
jgi:hypothetical protein